VSAGGLDDLAARLAQAGVPVRFDEALPARRFFAEDPWGNRIELTEPAWDEAR
jgi:hypothetical protein